MAIKHDDRLPDAPIKIQGTPVAGVEQPFRGSSRRAVIVTVAQQAISDRLL